MKILPIRISLLPIILLFLVSCFNSNHLVEKEYFLVTKVVDGDTFWVNDGSKKGMKIRLIGVDAPESRKTGRKEIGYFGKESKEFLSSFILNKKVYLEYDLDKYDQYQRVLSYAYLEDGTFVNELLVMNGYAMVMTVPPNIKYAKKFLRLQQEAREKSRGLWGKE